MRSQHSSQFRNLLTTAPAIAKETGYKTTELHLLDLSSFTSVVEFAEKFKHDPLDIVIENAGVATPNYETTSDGWELTYAILLRLCD